VPLSETAPLEIKCEVDQGNHDWDPGGEPLDRVVERDQGQPLDLTHFLRIAIGLVAALGQVHRRGLIRTILKSPFVLLW
jgi:hypothetical protein